MLKDLILQIAQFPGAESLHMLQGAVAGYLLVQGYLKDSVARVSIALTILVGFIAYETLEQWRIGDNGDLDTQAALISMWICGIITLAISLIRKAQKGK